MLIQEIVNSWHNDEPIYNKIGSCVSKVIKSHISEYEILPEISFRTKELLSIVKKIKKKQCEKEYSYDSLKDKLGIRIICTFESELKIVDKLLKEYFIIENAEYKKENLDFNKLDYQSNHYDVKIKSELIDFKSIKKYDNYVFEVQVRTLNQHAWANAAHKLSYKQDCDLPSDVKRKLYRLLSLYELSDQEIEAINKHLINETKSPLDGILHKIEGKIYKYAKVDFDRETTLYTLNSLNKFISATNLNKIQHEIESFINDNDVKIRNIFIENEIRFHEISFLTQPEIFIIWYALENFEFSLIDNWNNYFDSSDLDQIKTLWGKNIND